ncbi:MAG: hypothetical protein AAGU21_14405 [Solidesulfovibrio sp.]|uniref:hypothetical protein n=1 Tax=Solidesulfovibrio sp. TaxID=2910990 RepID=UPI002B2175C1|nr:hypothetical protein [Solidesulfovibrio sp.]MEA4857187.1 hypothetical protein [Solidesulfovibrio sp.]
MKNALARFQETPGHVLDIRQPEHAARLGEAFAQERLTVQAALAELATMRYGDAAAREDTALATMAPMPGHGLMARAPREFLRLRAALFLVSCHEHRKN